MACLQVRPFAVLAVAMGLLACDGATEFSDAGSDDVVAPDAATGADAGFGTVSVLVLGWLADRGQPQADIPVLFHDAGGALITRAVTGADGRASADVAGGGMVTVVQEDASWITTIVGVEAGDQLVVGQEYDHGVASGSTTVNVPAGGTTYSVSGPCSYGSAATTAVNVQLTDGCDANRPLLVMRNLNAIDGFIYVPSTNVAAGTPVTITDAWQTPGSFTVALTGFDGSTYSDLSAFVLEDGRRVGSVSRTLPAATEGAIETSFAYPTGAGDATLVAMFINSGTGNGFRFYIDHDGGPRTSLTLDADAMLPLPTLAPPDGSATLRWDAGGTGHDGTMIVHSGEGEKGEDLGRWDVIAPPSADALDLPTLPEDLAHVWEPWFARVTLYTIESSAFDDYTELRASPGLPNYLPHVLDGPHRTRTASASR